MNVEKYVKYRTKTQNMGNNDECFLSSFNTIKIATFVWINLTMDLFKL